MREIKFRAWDKQTNNWLEGVMYTLHTSGRLIVTPSHVELTQYTGLKDKTGKEIYEGDIVKVAQYHGVVVWDSVTDGWRIQLKNQFFLRNNEMVVVGNIYENPDLLEAQP